MIEDWVGVGRIVAGEPDYVEPVSGGLTLRFVDLVARVRGSMTFTFARLFQPRVAVRRAQVAKALSPLELLEEPSFVALPLGHGDGWFADLPLLDPVRGRLHVGGGVFVTLSDYRTGAKPIGERFELRAAGPESPDIARWELDFGDIRWFFDEGGLPIAKTDRPGTTVIQLVWRPLATGPFVLDEVVLAEDDRLRFEWDDDGGLLGIERTGNGDAVSYERDDDGRVLIARDLEQRKTTFEYEDAIVAWMPDGATPSTALVSRVLLSQGGDRAYRHHLSPGRPDGDDRRLVEHVSIAARVETTRTFQLPGEPPRREVVSSFAWQAPERIDGEVVTTGTSGGLMVRSWYRPVPLADVPSWVLVRREHTSPPGARFPFPPRETTLQYDETVWGGFFPVERIDRVGEAGAQTVARRVLTKYQAKAGRWGAPTDVETRAGDPLARMMSYVTTEYHADYPDRVTYSLGAEIALAWEFAPGDPLDPGAHVLPTAVVVGPLGGMRTTQAWDAWGNLVKSIDPGGVVTHREFGPRVAPDGSSFDGAVLLRERVEPAAVAPQHKDPTFTFPGMGAPVQPLETKLDMDPFTGRLRSITWPDGGSFRSEQDTRQWDRLGRLVQESLAGRVAETHTWDVGAGTERVAYENGFVETHYHDGLQGRLGLVREALGGRREYWSIPIEEGQSSEHFAPARPRLVRHRDGLGRVVREEAETGEVVTWTYDDTYELISFAAPTVAPEPFTLKEWCTRVLVNGPRGAQEELYFDCLGRPALARRVAHHEGQVQHLERAWSYNLLALSGYREGDASVLFDQDSTGRLRGTWTSDDAQVELDYYPNGALMRRLGPGKVVENVGLDALGRPVAVGDGVGRLKLVTRWDGRGRAVAGEDFDGSTWTLEADGLSLRRTTVTPSGNELRYELNPLLAEAGHDGGWLEIESDKFGLLTRTWDGLGQLVSVNDHFLPDAGSSLTYDDEGSVVGVHLADGATWKSTPDTWGAPRTIEDPFQETTSIDRPMGRLVDTVSLPGGARRLIMHDTAGRFVKATQSYDPDAASPGHGDSAPWDEATYDDQGNPATRTDPDGVVTQLRREAHLASPIEGAKPLPGYRIFIERAGQTTVFGWNPEGTLAFREDPNRDRLEIEYDPVGRPTRTWKTGGLVTRFVYDRRDRVVEQVLAHAPTPGSVDVAESVTKYTWDDAARLLTRTDPTGKKTFVRYDQRDRVLQTWVGDVAQQRALRTFEWDGDDRLKSIREGKKGFHELWRKWSFTYDDKARTVMVTDPFLRHTVLTRDELGRPKELSADGHRTSFAWSPDGREVTRTDPIQRKSRLAFDPAGQLLRAELPAPPGRTNEPSPATTLTRSAGGRPLVRTTPDGANWPSFFNEQGHLTATAPPGQAPRARPAITLAPDVPRLPRLPDEKTPGLLCADVTPTGLRATLGHLTLDVVIDAGAPTLGATTQCIGDPSDPESTSKSVVFAGYDAQFRRLSGRIDVQQPRSPYYVKSPWPSGRDAYSRPFIMKHDAAGRLLTVEQFEPTHSLITRTYDEDGRLSTLTVEWDATYPFTQQQLVIRYEYDDFGDLASIHPSTTVDEPKLTLLRDEVGQVRVRTTAPVSDNTHYGSLGTEQTEVGRAEEHLDYDPFGRVSRRSAGIPFCITHDDTIHHPITTDPLVPAPASAWLAQVDPAGVTTPWSEDDIARVRPHPDGTLTGSSCWQFAYPRLEEEFDYDPAGRLKSWTATPLIAYYGTPFSKDHDGDLEEVDAWPQRVTFEKVQKTFEYDERDRPGTSDDYDPSGNRKANGEQGADHMRTDWTYDAAGRPTSPGWSWDAGSRIARAGRVHLERSVFGGADSVKVLPWDDGDGDAHMFKAELLWDPELGLLGVREEAESWPGGSVSDARIGRRETWVVPEGPERTAMILVVSPQYPNRGESMSFLRAGGAWVDSQGRATASYGDVGAHVVYGSDNKVISKHPFGAAPPGLPFALLINPPPDEGTEGASKSLAAPVDWMQICSPSSRIWLSEERQFAHPRPLDPEDISGLDHRYQEFFGAPSPYLAAETFMAAPAVVALPDPEVPGEAWFSWAKGTGLTIGGTSVALGIASFFGLWPARVVSGLFVAAGIYSGAESRRELSEREFGLPLSWFEAVDQSAFESILDLPVALRIAVLGTDPWLPGIRYSPRARAQRLLGAVASSVVGGPAVRFSHKASMWTHLMGVYGNGRRHGDHRMGPQATAGDLWKAAGFLTEHEGMLTGNTLNATRERTPADAVILAYARELMRKRGRPNDFPNEDFAHSSVKIYEEIFIDDSSLYAIPRERRSATSEKLIQQGYRSLMAVKGVTLNHRRLYRLSDIREFGVPVRAWLSDVAFSWRLRGETFRANLHAEYTHGAHWNPEKAEKRGAMGLDLDMGLLNMSDIINGKTTPAHRALADEFNERVGLVWADADYGVTSMYFDSFRVKGDRVPMQEVLARSGWFPDPKGGRVYRDGHPHARWFGRAKADLVAEQLSLYRGYSPFDDEDDDN